MGKTISYQRLFPEDGTEDDQRSIRWSWKLFTQRCKRFVVKVFILSYLITVATAIFYGNRNSELSNQLTECQEQLQKQITQAQDTNKFLKICTETLESGHAKAKKDSDDLHVQLVTTNQSLNKTHQQWETCEKELNAWNNSIRIHIKQQEAEKHKLQECQAQLQNQTAQIQTQAAIKNIEALKKVLEKAKKAGDDLPAQLVTAIQYFNKTQQLLNSCRKELNNLHHNTNIQAKQQEAEKLKLQEKIRSLQKDLQDQLQAISEMKNEMKL